ncbi:MAG: hypothetical protein KDC42_06990 [Ignavibacteriae bacterium]|nr:hypothetical protein [Ignavibacteriota bacterium]
MKTKIILIFFIVAFTAIAGLSQPNNDNYKYSGKCGDRAGYMADYLNDQLNLSDDQYNKVYSTLLSHEQQRDEDFEKYSGDRDAFRDASDKRRTDLDNSMKSILNSDQYDKYTQIENNMRNNLRRKYGKGKMGMN